MSFYNNFVCKNCTGDEGLYNTVNVSNGNDNIENITEGVNLRSENDSTRVWNGPEDFIGLDMLIPITEVSFKMSWRSMSHHFYVCPPVKPLEFIWVPK